MHLSTVIKSEPNLKASRALATALKNLFIQPAKCCGSLITATNDSQDTLGNFWNVNIGCHSGGKLLECNYCWAKNLVTAIDSIAICKQ